MKKIDKIALIGMLTLAVGLSIFSCKADIMLPPDRGIEGEYRGILKVVDEIADSTVFQAVTMSIRTNLTYGYQQDETDTIFGVKELICNSSGLYFFADGKITFNPTDSSGGICDPSTIPSGPGFSFFKTPVGGTVDEIGDKLTITQIIVDDNEIIITTTEFQLTLLSIP